MGGGRGHRRAGGRVGGARRQVDRDPGRPRSKRYRRRRIRIMSSDPPALEPNASGGARANTHTHMAARSAYRGTPAGPPTRLALKSLARFLTRSSIVTRYPTYLSVKIPAVSPACPSRHPLSPPPIRQDTRSPPPPTYPPRRSAPFTRPPACRSRQKLISKPASGRPSFAHRICDGRARPKARAHGIVHAHRSPFMTRIPVGQWARQGMKYGDGDALFLLERTNASFSRTQSSV